MNQKFHSRTHIIVANDTSNPACWSKSKIGLSRLLLLFLIFQSTFLFAQYNGEYNDSYQKALKIMQSGIINPDEIQKMCNEIYNNESIKFEKSSEELKIQLANRYFNQAEEKARKLNFIGAIIDYDIAINYHPSSLAYNNKGCAQNAIGEYKNAIISFKKAFEYDSSDAKILENEMNALKMLIKIKTAPLSINEIKIANSDYDGNIETDFGNTIYSTNSMYLLPKIYYTSNATGRIKLQIRFYQPNGILCVGNNSPSGYTYNSEISLDSNGSTKLLSWGSPNKGYWSSGKYRIEIWWDGCCLAHNGFEIYNRESVVKPFPPTPPISTQKQVCFTCLGSGRCNVCGGTGIYSRYGNSHPCSACKNGICYRCNGTRFEK